MGGREEPRALATEIEAASEVTGAQGAGLRGCAALLGPEGSIGKEVKQKAQGRRTRGAVTAAKRATSEAWARKDRELEWDSFIEHNLPKSFSSDNCPVYLDWHKRWMTQVCVCERERARSSVCVLAIHGVADPAILSCRSS